MIRRMSFLVFLFVTINVAVCTLLCGPEEDPTVPEKTFLQVYTSANVYSESIASILQNPNNIKAAINSTKPSILYIHGFTEGPDSITVKTIVQVYLQRGDVNVIIVDWSILAAGYDYLAVSRRVPAVGVAVARALQLVFGASDVCTVNVIGHSLGAHVAGYIGRFFNGCFIRIIGLDPAQPLFYPSDCHLRASDASNVVALHTDRGVFGAAVDTGTIDFYANKGMAPQPGCPIILDKEACSHQRSVMYYAESITNPTAFPAQKCLLGIVDDSNDSSVIYFGDATPNGATGEYCFDTNAQPPYSKTSKR